MEQLVKGKNPDPLSSFVVLKELIINTWRSLGALLLPLIILGGIYSGVFTPTEAAAIGVVYSLIIGIFVYKEIVIKDLLKLLVKSMETAAMINIKVQT